MYAVHVSLGMSRPGRPLITSDSVVQTPAAVCVSVSICAGFKRGFVMNQTAIICLLCSAPILLGQQTEVAVQSEAVVPAGTLLRCTLDEPNFSSATAQVGDPVLCHATSIEMFGRPLIPRGAYLSARLEEFKDPGHFVGKGWIQLEFNSLTLPNGNFPINAKVISAARYRVDGEGKIKGRGHPTRDAVEWMIPILWPVKVLTLPARGPRPALKGETRLELRLMEDLLLPDSSRPATGGLPSRSSELLPRPNHSPVPTTPSVQPSTKSAQVPSLRQTVLILRGGRFCFAVDYWVNSSTLKYTTDSGGPQSLPLDLLDMHMTQKLNAERGVTFALRTGHY